MTSTTTLLRVEDGVRLPGPALPAGRVVTVSFDGRYVWAFQPARDGRREGGDTVVPWPVSLQPHLRGRTRLTLAEPGDDGAVHLDEDVQFGPTDAPLTVVDPHGHPLAVNKVGNLTRVFAETDDSVRRSVLEGTAQVIEDLRTHGGVEAYLNYGCLLGAVREGRMIGTDCDADVTYLSEKTSPADVVLESFALERAMLARGWRTVRMSGGDFKVLLATEDGRTVYVDVFLSFHADGVFYQLGNRSGSLAREAILPLRPITLEGVTLPGPADPEAVLAFNYGPGWRVPDPAFKFEDPVAGIQRLDGWLRGTREELPHWNALFRSPRAEQIPRARSDFAAWVLERVKDGDPVADIGCGFGRDSAYFARQGHPVLAYDVSPDARRRTQRRLRRLARTGTGVEGPPVRRLMLDELRTVGVTAAEIAASAPRRHLHARLVAGVVGDEGRRNLWRLARAALTGSGGSLFLELATTEPPGAPSAPPERSPGSAGLVRRLDVSDVLRELTSYGGRVLDREDGTGTDLFDHADPRTCRLQVDFPEPGGPR